MKSDDVAGRTKVYETIVKGNNNLDQEFQSPSMFLLRKSESWIKYRIKLIMEKNLTKALKIKTIYRK